jgi:putative glutamine amidotransferase
LGELQTIKTGCDVDYTDSTVRSGGAQLLLPCTGNVEVAHAAIEVCDGVILTGGGDVVSLCYGEEPHESSKYQDPVRDNIEFEIAKLALEKRVPILGICRGMQVLNVVLGGTLVQDIPSQIPNAIKHYSQASHTAMLHHIDIESDWLFARVVGSTTMAINSWHHQAVKDVGSDLKITARSHDGVAEGMEATDGRALLMVQFHPEECTDTYPQFQLFFDWIVQEARGYRAERHKR